MLAARIKTALILVPIILLAIFFLPAFWFSVVCLAVFMLIGWEYTHLIQLTSLIQKIFFLIILFVTCVIFLLLIPVKLIFYIALVFWVLATFCILLPEKFKRAWNYTKILRWIIGVFLFASTWYAFVILKTWPANLTILLMTVWVADSGAYFVGKKWGKHKLAPLVSPRKTIEGAIGGLVFLVIWACFINVFYFQKQFFPMIVLMLITGFAAMVGDLFESLIKRISGVKDSGNILPGHGGLLDRADSLLAAAPIYALIFSLFF